MSVIRAEACRGNGRGLHYENKAWMAPGIKELVPPSQVKGYADSDWAGDQDTAKSTTGYLVFLAGGPISFRSVLQKIQAHSSAEAEYGSMSDCAREIQYISNILQEVGLLKQTGPIQIYSDSSAAIAMTQNKGVSHRTKHIAIRYHYVKTLIEEGVVSVHKISTEVNPADILTKATDVLTFARHADVCAPRIQLSDD